MLRRSSAVLAALFLACCLAIAPRLNDYPDKPSQRLSTREPINAFFEITWMGGELVLSGHTISKEHESGLSELAASSFTGTTITTNFEPLAIVPRYWEDVTLQVLYTLSVSSSAYAKLAPERLDLRTVVVDEVKWRARLNALLQTLPQSIAVSQDTILIDAKHAAVELCRTVLNDFSAGDINFKMSSSAFQNSAIPRLQRVTAVADLCRHASIQITGHTDASGSEPWNQRLSIDRANAVADYLADHGIDRARLRVLGAGSSVAIANNNSHYGRGLNRRIEIAFIVPVPQDSLAQYETTRRR